MTSAYTKQLGLQTRKTNVWTEKIDDSLLRTYEIVIAIFQIRNKLGKVLFFQKTFLLTNTSIKILLKMLFLTFSNANI